VDKKRLDSLNRTIEHKKCIHNRQASPAGRASGSIGSRQCKNAKGQATDSDGREARQSKRRIGYRINHGFEPTTGNTKQVQRNRGISIGARHSLPVLRADGNAMRHCNRSSDIAPARSKELEASP
jgi:hypothetical protein